MWTLYLYHSATHQQVDLVPGGGDERHGEAAVEVGGPGLVDLQDPVVRPQQARGVRGAAGLDPRHEDAALVQAVRHREPEVLEYRIFEQ